MTGCPVVVRMMCVGMVALGGVIGALAEGLRFQFGTENAPAGWTLVGITNFYIPATGYGFEHVSNLGAGKAFVASDEPFFFSVRLPEGNYLVSVTLGGDVAESVTTIKAEARRLMVERLRVPRRESVQRQFIVNVHTPHLPDGGQVRLKRRELETERVSWDGRLTLEFNGFSPSLRALEIVPTNVPTIFVTGDSTVCDQPRERGTVGDKCCPASSGRRWRSPITPNPGSRSTVLWARGVSRRSSVR